MCGNLWQSFGWWGATVPYNGKLLRFKHSKFSCNGYRLCKTPYFYTHSFWQVSKTSHKVNNLLAQQLSSTHGKQLVIRHLFRHLNSSHLLNYFTQYCQVVADHKTHELLQSHEYLYTICNYTYDAEDICQNSGYPLQPAWHLHVLEYVSTGSISSPLHL